LNDRRVKETHATRSRYAASLLSISTFAFESGSLEIIDSALLGSDNERSGGGRISTSSFRERERRGVLLTLRDPIGMAGVSLAFPLSTVLLATGIALTEAAGTEPLS